MAAPSWEERFTACSWRRCQTALHFLPPPLLPPPPLPSSFPSEKKKVSFFLLRLLCRLPTLSPCRPRVPPILFRYHACRRSLAAGSGRRTSASRHECYPVVGCRWRFSRRQPRSFRFTTRSGALPSFRLLCALSSSTPGMPAFSSRRCRAAARREAERF